MIEIYVYYKVAPARVEALHAVLRAWPQVRLMRRDGELGELQTWMEVHTGPDAERTAAALDGLVGPFVEGSRQVERFLPVATPAP
ncbi:DUF4936 family protein [Pelomonas sp. KK5]|uniref:DUF4936 family protein n=1 Tax=Pelomonas sp. KK5 TaxID=1855730 RepID=UPI00097C7A99|nr:DUF4936 family protein [Pelomonas sp. KK5]